MKYTAFSAAFFLFICSAAFAEQDIRDSIVKIYCVSNSPDYDNPWDRQGPEKFYGSGCVIAGNRILTNAHVVSDHTFIQVQLHGQPIKYNAQVLFVSHEADLALLTVEDQSFFSSVKALKMGELPQVSEKVTVYGFPKGGDTLSTTEGIISRIEHQDYVHSYRSFLAIQIDAAVNGGNSGGPAIVKDKIVGVVMQGMENADNIGYIIPTTVVNHFLNDVADGAYDGFPEIGIFAQEMENKDLKGVFNLKKPQTGVLVRQVIPGGLSDGILLPGDIVSSIDGIQIADDGTVEFRRNERTCFIHILQNHQYGESVRLNVVRQGKLLRIGIPLRNYKGHHNYVSLCEYDTQPRYYIYGGLVFCPLTLNYLKTWDKWETQAPSNLLYFLRHGIPTEKGEEVVILLSVLEADINLGYDDHTDKRILKVNNQKVVNLEQLIKLIEDQKDEPYVTIETENGFQLALNNKRALAEHDEILNTYGISQDRPDGLVKLADLN